MNLVVITSALEYATSWIMEKMFSTRWWDYSSSRFNLQGRVCLRIALMFGIISIVTVRVLHPLVMTGMEMVPVAYRNLACAILFITLIIDYAMTLKTLISMKGVISRLYKFTESLKEHAEMHEWFNESDIPESFAHLKELARADTKNIFSNLADSLDSVFKPTKGIHRLVCAFPSMTNKQHSGQLGYLKTVYVKKRKS